MSAISSSWVIKPGVKDQCVFSFVFMNDNEKHIGSSTVTEYLRITIIDVSKNVPFIIQIPLRILVVREGLNFAQSFIFLGVISSTAEVLTHCFIA